MINIERYVSIGSSKGEGPGAESLAKNNWKSLRRRCGYWSELLSLRNIIMPEVADDRF